MTHSGTFVVRCDPEAAFNLLSTPERFAPLLPDLESMTMQDATHFTIRTLLDIGRINGRINLSMELSEASRPHRVGYRGHGVIAGSPLQFELGFRITPVDGMTEIQWHGEVRLNGSLIFLAGDLLDTMSRQNFGRMADSLQCTLRRLSLSSASGETSLPDFEI